MSTWPDWTKWIQLAPRFLFGLWVFGAIVLWLPQGAASTFGIETLREDHRSWIGLGTLAAFIFWCVQLVPAYNRRRGLITYRRRVIGALAALSPEEWLLIAYCLMHNRRTLTLPLTDRAASTLASKGIFELAIGVGHRFAWPYTIPSFVWEHLQENVDSFVGGLSPTDEHLRDGFNDVERRMTQFGHFG